MYTHTRIPTEDPDSKRVPATRAPSTRRSRVVALALLVAAVVLVVLVPSVPVKNDANGNRVGEDSAAFEADSIGRAQPAPPKVCLSAHCTKVAAALLNSMKETTDPCDDFYEFACGGYASSRDIPADKTRIGTFDDLYEDNLRVLREILESPTTAHSVSLSHDGDVDNAGGSDSGKEKSLEARMLHLYGSCMNQTNIAKAGLQPLAKRIVRLLHPASAPALAGLVANLHADGVRALFAFGVTADQKDTDLNRIYMGQGGLTLPSKEYYADTETVKFFELTVRKMWEILLHDDAGSLAIGNNPILSDPKAAARAVVLFESAIAKISLSRDELRDPSKVYNPMTVSALQRLAPKFNWNDYLTSRFPANEFPGVINPETTVVIETPTFFGNISNLLAATDNPTLDAYFHWHVIRSSARFLADDIKQPITDLAHRLSGQQTDPPREKICLGAVEGAMGFVLGRAFLAERFPPGSKKLAQQMIQDVVTAFTKQIPHFDWLDNVTAAHAVKKANALTRKIGYPDYVLDVSKLYEKYRGLSISPISYADNVVNVAQFQDLRNRREILKPVDKAEWDMYPQTVNAYYNPSFNEIAFPAGILQSPFFHADSPMYLNYGAAGAVIGHELTHAFDDEGRNYDAQGRLRDWWTPDVAKRFSAKAQCFVKQYSNYSITGPDGKQYHVNGKLTLGENLADNGGIARAFEAYRASPASQSFLLPGLSKYTPEQLFYVAFANVWCGKIRPETAVERIRTDPHSPPNYRVWGAIQNSERFSRVFSCKKNTRMNPDNKCILW